MTSTWFTEHSISLSSHTKCITDSERQFPSRSSHSFPVSKTIDKLPLICDTVRWFAWLWPNNAMPTCHCCISLIFNLAFWLVAYQWGQPVSRIRLYQDAGVDEFLFRFQTRFYFAYFAYAHVCMTNSKLLNGKALEEVIGYVSVIVISHHSCK